MSELLSTFVHWLQEPSESQGTRVACSPWSSSLVQCSLVGQTEETRPCRRTGSTGRQLDTASGSCRGGLCLAWLRFAFPACLLACLLVCHVVPCVCLFVCLSVCLRAGFHAYDVCPAPNTHQVRSLRRVQLVCPPLRCRPLKAQSVLRDVRVLVGGRLRGARGSSESNLSSRHGTHHPRRGFRKGNNTTAAPVMVIKRKWLVSFLFLQDSVSATTLTRQGDPRRTHCLGVCSLW
ncbi:hypothetical protein LX36DRAFT_98314 [Colletotrichum falcatum]|nr:hypothetical protein LX36DRAFT_98314 [Colletotrichum falcatum]